MVVQVYGHISSAPTRLVLMTCECLGIDYNFVVVDILTGEHKKDEYAKINPQQLVPSLVDGDFSMCESRAIVAYLANAYGSNDSKLYPTDPKIRGKVDQRMYFEMGTFYLAFADCCYPIAYGTIDHVKEDKLVKLKEVLAWMSEAVSKTGFAAETEYLTLADLTFICNFSSMVETNLYPEIFEDFPQLKLWFEKCQSLIPKYEEINHAGAIEYSKWFQSGLEKARSSK